MGQFKLEQEVLLRVLRAHGFRVIRQRGSHEQWEGVVDGRRRVVTVDLSYPELFGFVLASIIKQSGLPKSAFKK